MTREEWLSCTEAEVMKEFLRGGHSSRKLRLFAVACVRPFWGLLIDPHSRVAVSLAEQVADAQEMLDRLPPAFESAFDAISTLQTDRDACITAAHAAGRTVDPNASKVGWVTWNMIESVHAELSEEEGATEKERQELYIRGKARGEQFLSDVVREMFGDPFRPVAFDPAWRTSDVTTLATGIYNERTFDQLPILADALQEAGCDSDDLLNHLRDPAAAHVRGCWALDLVLGKE